MGSFPHSVLRADTQQRAPHFFTKHFHKWPVGSLLLLDRPQRWTLPAPALKPHFSGLVGAAHRSLEKTGTTLVKFITIPPHCERGWKCKTNKESPHCALTQSRLPYSVAEGQKQCGKQCVECAAFSAKIGKRGNLCNICSTRQRISLEGHAEMCDISCYREEGDPSPGTLHSSWHLSR